MRPRSKRSSRLSRTRLAYYAFAVATTLTPVALAWYGYAIIAAARRISRAWYLGAVVVFAALLAGSPAFGAPAGANLSNLTFSATGNLSAKLLSPENGSASPTL